jgi:hypothetical protein
LEIVVTAALFLLNAIVICVFAIVWLCYCVGYDFKKLRCRKVKQMRLVTDAALIEQVRLKLIEGGDGNGNDEEAPKLYWRHPVSSQAQEHPPNEVGVLRSGVAEGWVWTDERGKKSWSDIIPEVVSEIPDGGEKAKPGEFICTLDPKTMSLSPLLEVPPDVMSDPYDNNDQADDPRGVNGGIEMVENPAREAVENRRIVDNNNVENVGVEMVGNPMAVDNNNVENVGVEMVGNPMADHHHPTKEEDLRVGWRIEVSRTHGTEYYVNDETGERTYEKPTLPHGWKKKVSEDHDGAYFFENQHTGESSWDQPKSFDLRGWTAEVCEESGREYYTNEYTGDTQWDQPTLPAPPEGWSVHPNEDGDPYYQHDADGGYTQWHHPHDEPHDE